MTSSVLGPCLQAEFPRSLLMIEDDEAAWAAARAAAAEWAVVELVPASSAIPGSTTCASNQWVCIIKQRVGALSIYEMAKPPLAYWQGDDKSCGWYRSMSILNQHTRLQLPVGRSKP